MSKHTKGPWRVDPSANCDVQTADGQFEIATTHPEILCGGECDRSAARANAALIAAAPDMLAALEEIAAQEWVENCLDPQWAARIARAAIAKARGE